MQDSYRVLGFIAKGGMFPNFLVTVLQKNLELFALYPSGHLDPLTKEAGIPATEADLLERPTYTQDKRCIISQELAELRSFGFSRDDIVMGSLGYLSEEIDKRAAQPEISMQNATTLREILASLAKYRPVLQLLV